jgi:hypothetical protein
MLVSRISPAPCSSVDRHDDALRAEHLRQLRDQLRPRKGGGIDRDLVGACVEDDLCVLDPTHPAADGERDEHVLGRAPRQLDDRLALLVGSGDVEEDQLVRALRVVAGRELDGIAGVAQVDEVRPLDHPPPIDVEAGDDPLERHDRYPRRAPWTAFAASSRTR